MNKNLGHQIKAIRLAKNYAQRYVAKALGTSQPHVSCIERNKADISDQHLEQLSVVFEVSVHYIKTSFVEYISNDISPKNVPKLIEQYEKFVDTQNSIMVKQQRDNENFRKLVDIQKLEIDELKATINELRVMLAGKNNKPNLLKVSSPFSKIKHINI